MVRSAREATAIRYDPEDAHGSIWQSRGQHQQLQPEAAVIARMLTRFFPPQISSPSSCEVQTVSSMFSFFWLSSTFDVKIEGDAIPCASPYLYSPPPSLPAPHQHPLPFSLPSSFNFQPSFTPYPPTTFVRSTFRNAEFWVFRCSCVDAETPLLFEGIVKALVCLF